MITSTLIHQHTVITLRYTHDVVAACGYQKGCQVLDIVLVSFHMVGIAGIASHRDTCQFTHEVVLKTCSGNLFGIIQILRSDETNYGINKERMISSCESITTSFHGYLVPSVVCFGRKLRTLSSLEIHVVRTCTGSFLIHHLIAFIQHGSGQTESLITFLRSCDRLEQQVDRCALLLTCFHLSGYMSKYTDLSRNFPFILKFIKASQYSCNALYRVIYRVQTDNGITTSKRKTFHNRCHDSFRIICSMVRLQS